MYDFILQLAIVISLGAMVYLMARALHRVPDGEEVAAISDHNYFDKWLENIHLTKLEEWLHLVMAKFLRRLRIIVLKFDNLLHRSIASIHSTNGQKNKQSLMDSLNDKEK